MMVLVAYIVSLKTAKEAAAGTIRETRETIAEIGEAAVTIAENFQQAKITETFIESLPEVNDAGEGRLKLPHWKTPRSSSAPTPVPSCGIKSTWAPPSPRSGARNFPLSH